MQKLGTDPRRYLQEQIETFVRESPANHLPQPAGGAIFDPPLVGVADGDDLLFAQYKTIIGPFHLTPRETIAYALQEIPEVTHKSLERLSVLCWALPITQETRRSNSRQRKAPSWRWAQTRYHGEQFNDALRRHIVTLLREAGYLAVAPVLTPLLKLHREDAVRPPSSTWSERHILYAAGMGTFSLSDGFITPRGIAMRCGSVVTNLPLAADPRSYESHTANCLYLSEGTCGKCIARCPAGAITTQGHDKSKCEEYLHKQDYLKQTYQVGIAGCGLCQTAVPCEARIPRRRKR